MKRERDVYWALVFVVVVVVYLQFFYLRRTKSIFPYICKTTYKGQCLSSFEFFFVIELQS